MGETTIRAIVFWQRSIKRVICRAGNAAPVVMEKVQDELYWVTKINIPGTELCTIMVEAHDENDRPGRHTTLVATDSYKINEPMQNGSDSASIGAWLENGISGTQPGPNRNGKPFDTGPKKSS